MKKIFCITCICIISLGFTACGNNDWEKEESMGEISIDPEDTESLEPEEIFSIKDTEEYYDLNLDNIVEKENTDAYSIVVHECNYYSKNNNVVLKGMVHILTEPINTVTLEIFNKNNEQIAFSTLTINENADEDINFSIEAEIEDNKYNSDDISIIKVSAR